jgi:hypothetical protein
MKIVSFASSPLHTQILRAALNPRVGVSPTRRALGSNASNSGWFPLGKWRIEMQRPRSMSAHTINWRRASSERCTINSHAFPTTLKSASAIARSGSIIAGSKARAFTTSLRPASFSAEAKLKPSLALSAGSTNVRGKH